jgi:hypothetical protein
MGACADAKRDTMILYRLCRKANHFFMHCSNVLRSLLPLLLVLVLVSELAC